MLHTESEGTTQCDGQDPRFPGQEELRGAALAGDPRRRLTAAGLQGSQQKVSLAAAETRYYGLM